jgi:hypothetical protein
MDRVKIPKRVAEAIEGLKKLHWETGRLLDMNEIIQAKGYNGLPSVIYEYVYSNDKNIENYMKAVLNGYEIEMTREERLLEVYKSYEKGSLEAVHPIGKERYHLVCQGIKIALDELGIKIKGINTQ